MSMVDRAPATNEGILVMPVVTNKRLLSVPSAACCLATNRAAPGNLIPTSYPDGEKIMKTSLLWMIAAGCFVGLASDARARSTYDGSWDLAFVTQKGACDPSYNFTVNVSDGIVS